MPERLIIGAMSGTSADGVDVALCEINWLNSQYLCRYIGHVESPFPTQLKQQILTLRIESQVSLENLARLTREISICYAEAVKSLLNKLNIAPEKILTIAAHGQTMFHSPPLTMQIFDPALVAYETGIDVISDFRRADCAAGGQGAPLVPFSDYHLFRSNENHRVILNIGGISNITVLKKGCSIDKVIGFDTGPGNCISDWLLQDRCGIDLDGELAAAGKSHADLIEELLTSSYFRSKPPKSTDGPAMIRIFEEVVKTKPLSLEDKLAIASELVARTIDLGIRQSVDNAKNLELIAAGGGTKNRSIMKNLERLGYAIHTTDEFNIPTQAREAIAFAILGSATLDRIPANLPSVTGAKQKVILGSITTAK